MGKQIDSLRHEEATAAGRKIAQMIEALNEVQGQYFGIFSFWISHIGASFFEHIYDWSFSF